MKSSPKEIGSEITEILPSEKKKSYLAPKLREFGRVHHLTHGASGMVGDGNTGMFMAQSERHLKHNIVRVGDHPAGFGLYLFDYKPEFQGTCGEGRQFGVMVDEVEPIMPDAISLHASGCKQVNYTMLGILRADA